MRFGLSALLAALAAAALVTSPASAGLPASFVATVSGPGEGSLYRGTFPSATAPRPLRPGYVYLPPGFSPRARYPVVYLLHGMPGAPGEYVDALGFRLLADALIQTGSVKPFIAVVPAAGPSVKYNGEWAGPWETYLVRDVVPWVDSRLPTEANRSNRILAGLSAGGYGAVDIGVRNPRIFGTIESWSGYFHPLHDGPFKAAPSTVLAANDPTLLVAEKVRQLRALGTRFFVGSGPTHSRWFKEQESVDFGRELGRLCVRHSLVLVTGRERQYSLLLRAGLIWALHA